ncbi:MAG: MFS transporter [Proteobacteria bacterium]|nr:MAG: MFS transporter [Pseudomonadota bacterium]
MESENTTLNRKAGAKGIAYASSAMFSASQALLFVMYPILSERLNLSLSQVVACFTAGSFLFLWGGPYWAQRSDADGRAKILHWGQLGVFVSLLALGFLLLQVFDLSPAVSFVILLVSRLIYGALGSAVVPVAQAIVVDESPKESRTKALTTNSMFLNTGRLLGPILALLLTSFSPLYLIGLSLFILLGIMSFAQGRVLSGPKVPRATFRMADIWPRKKEAQHIFLLAFFTTAFLGIFQSSLGAYLQALFQLTPENASHLMARLLIVGALVTVAVQLLARGKMKNPWQGSLPLGALSLLFGVLILQVQIALPALFIAVALMSVGLALLTPSYTSAMSFHYQNEQGKAAGGLSAAHTLGYSFGGLLSSVALNWNTRLPFVLAALLALLILGTLRPIYRGRDSLVLANSL